MSSKKNQGGDERFLRVQKDPRFWEMPERERKVKIDKRFQSMFHDKRFKVKYTVDKRGRPINLTSTEDLKRFYQVSDSEGDEDEGDEKSQKAAEVKKKSKVKKAGRPERGVRVVQEGEWMFLTFQPCFRCVGCSHVVTLCFRKLNVIGSLNLLRMNRRFVRRGLTLRTLYLHLC